MTAREKRAIAPPALPPELWELIFDLATCVPGTLIPDIYEHSNIIGPLYNRKFHGALRAALVTKRYLVRVCKQWWHLARRYLYQAIYIGRTRGVLSLCNTLKKYAAGGGTVSGVYSLGLWTQRLDIVIRDLSNDFDVECKCLAEIIRSLPNLAIVSFVTTSESDWHYEIPDSVVDALQWNAPSLRVLDWPTYTDDYMYPLKDLLKVVSLRILRCDGLPFSVDLVHTLSSVHTLILQKLFESTSYLDKLVPGEVATNLRELTLVADIAYYPLWRDFTQLYGIHLTSVHLQQGDIGDEDDITTFLIMICESCPNLRRITLSVLKFSYISLDGFSLPPVQYFGIAAEAHQQPRSAYKHLFTVLAFVKDTVPTLRVVQLIDPRNVNALLTRHSKVATRALNQLLVGSAFHIECHDGMRLSGASGGMYLHIVF